ncbi:hypothetical protein Tco_0088095 [Tanacetum coccineum]
MSNSNTNLQTQSSNALHNAIMEAGSKDRPPMLAPVNSSHHGLQIHHTRINGLRRQFLVAEGSSETTQRGIGSRYLLQSRCLPTAVKCGNLERLKQGESIKVQDSS